MEYTGGIFWDVLLLSEYNDKWEDFYLNLLEVLPCKRCSDEIIKFHLEDKKRGTIPKFKNNDEKNEWLWEIRKLIDVGRGGGRWASKVRKNNYTLETWKEYLNKPFTAKTEYLD